MNLNDGHSKEPWIVLALMITAVIVLFAVTAAQADGPVVDPAFVKTKELACTLPTAREGGMALSPDEIDRIDFYRAASSKGPWEKIGSDPNCRFTDDISELSPGQYYYMAKAVDTDGRESAPSNLLPLDVRRIQPPAAITDLGWR